MSERKIKIVVALRSEILVTRLYFVTPAFDGPEERKCEDVLEFDIKGNHGRKRNLERSGDNSTFIYLASFEDEGR